MQSWTDEQVEYLIENYQTVDNKDIAKVLNKTEPSISHKANRLGLKRDKSNIRKYSCKDDYFDTFSHNMAYIVGFIAADGYRYRDRYSTSKHSNTICITLQARDIAVLEFIKKELEFSGEIKRHFNKQFQKEYVCLKINSKRCVDKLETLGIIQCKSGKEKFPDIPKEFISSYILGFFDGDGCIHFNQEKDNYSFGVVCLNKEFLQKFVEITNLGYIGKVSPSKLTKQQLYNWIVSKHEHLKQLYYYLYSNSSFKLNRKYEKFRNLIQYLNTKIDKRLKITNSIKKEIYKLYHSGTSTGEILKKYNSVSKTSYYRIINERNYNECQ